MQVTMYAAWEDHGQGADMGVLVSSHETLRQAGIRPEQIKLVMNDTKTCPNAGPAGGSRSQVMSGNACRLAAENLVAANILPFVISHFNSRRQKLCNSLCLCGICCTISTVFLTVSSLFRGWQAQNTPAVEFLYNRYIKIV